MNICVENRCTRKWLCDSEQPGKDGVREASVLGISPRGEQGSAVYRAPFANM